MPRPPGALLCAPAQLVSHNSVCVGLVVARIRRVARACAQTGRRFFTVFLTLMECMSRTFAPHGRLRLWQRVFPRTKREHTRFLYHRYMLYPFGATAKRFQKVHLAKVSVGGWGGEAVFTSGDRGTPTPRQPTGSASAYLGEYTADFHRNLRDFHVHRTYLSVSTAKSCFYIFEKNTAFTIKHVRYTYSC